MSSGGVPQSTRPATPSPTTAQPSRPRRKWISIVSFSFGTVVLAFVVGAVMFFQLPPSDFLAKGFVGGRAWFEKQAIEGQPAVPDFTPAAGGIDKPQNLRRLYSVLIRDSQWHEYTGVSSGHEVPDPASVEGAVQ